MKKIVIASMERAAGKTSIIVGLMQSAVKGAGYLKPFGDRLLYRKKRLWDYDSALIKDIFNLAENPEDMSVGFEHAKLRYMYNDAQVKERLLQGVADIGQGKDILFVEGGSNLMHGASVRLDALTIAKHIQGRLVIVVSGSEDSIMDDIAFIKRYGWTADVDFGGVIINKVHDVENFKSTYMRYINEMGIPVLGVVPRAVELTYFSVNYLADALFAKVVAGEGGINKAVKNIFVGAMSADIAMRSPLFKRENKLIITSGDRSDMILAALETGSAGVILTNNILPPSNIISKASSLNVPLLLVSSDTFETAKRIDVIEPLLTKDDREKIELLGHLVGHLDFNKLLQ